MELYILENSTASMTSYYEVMEQKRDSARQRASELEDRYGSASGLVVQEDGTVRSFAADPQTFSFTVGNPTDSENTVDLRMRPINVPVGWSYSLDKNNPTLAAGATTEVELTITPGDQRVVEGTEVRVAVEGFIDGEYIGGILFGEWVPGQDLVVKPDAPEADLSSVYLPLIQR
jgi:hypothetical protein